MVLHPIAEVAMSTMPVRIDGELFESAKATGAVLSRSAAQQLAHWAKLGRELEASSTLNQRDIQRVLAGRKSYDSLAAAEQAVVRSEWDERIEAARSSLNLEEEFRAAGRTWSEADADGNVVTRE